MLTLVLLALIVVIMNIAGLEMAANQDLDWDREFRATGLASVVAGLGGGTAASMIVPASLRSKLFGAATRLTGVVAALVIAAALFSGRRDAGAGPGTAGGRHAVLRRRWACWTKGW